MAASAPVPHPRSPARWETPSTMSPPDRTLSMGFARSVGRFAGHSRRTWVAPLSWPAATPTFGGSLVAHRLQLPDRARPGPPGDRGSTSAADDEYDTGDRGVLTCRQPARRSDRRLEASSPRPTIARWPSMGAWDGVSRVIGGAPVGARPTAHLGPGPRRRPGGSRAPPGHDPVPGLAPRPGPRRLGPVATPPPAPAAPRPSWLLPPAAPGATAPAAAGAPPSLGASARRRPPAAARPPPAVPARPRGRSRALAPARLGPGQAGPGDGPPPQHGGRGPRLLAAGRRPEPSPWRLVPRPLAPRPRYARRPRVPRWRHARAPPPQPAGPVPWPARPRPGLGRPPPRPPPPAPGRRVPPPRQRRPAPRPRDGDALPARAFPRRPRSGAPPPPPPARATPGRSRGRPPRPGRS